MMPHSHSQTHSLPQSQSLPQSLPVQNKRKRPLDDDDTPLASSLSSTTSSSSTESTSSAAAAAHHHPHSHRTALPSPASAFSPNHLDDLPPYSAYRNLSLKDQTAKNDQYNKKLNVVVAKNAAPFLIKLYTMVDDPASNHLICWSDHGQSFIVTSPEVFAKEVLPRFYRHSNLSSFIRQLNMYGFCKLPHVNPTADLSSPGSSFLEFTHAQFQRGRPELLSLVTRKKSGSGDEKSDLDVNQVVSEITSIKQHQMVISSDLSTIQMDNRALWTELMNSRNQFRKQQEVIDKILGFLSVIFTDQDEKQQLRHKKRKLMNYFMDSWGSGSEASSGSSGAEGDDEGRHTSHSLLMPVLMSQALGRRSKKSERPSTSSPSLRPETPSIAAPSIGRKTSPVIPATSTGSFVTTRMEPTHPMSTNYPNGIPRTLGYSHSYQNLSQDINKLQSNLESYMDSIGIADPGELRSFSLADFYGPNEGPNGTNPNQAKDSINLLLSSTLDLSSPSSFRPSEHTAEPLEDHSLVPPVDPKPFLPCMNGSISPAPGNGTTSKMNTNSSKPLGVHGLAQNYLIPNSELVNLQMMSHTTTGSAYRPSTSLPQDSVGIQKVPVTNGVPLPGSSGPMYPVASTIPPSILSSIPTSSLRVNNVVDAIPQTTQIPFSVPVNIPVHPPVGSVEAPFTTAVPLQYAISPELVLNPQGIPLVPILPTALPISTVPQSQPTLNATFPIVSPLPLQRSNSIPESCPSITRTSSSISNSISTASPTPSATDEVEFSTSISPPIPSSSNPTLPLMQPFISTPFVNPIRLPIHNPTGTQNPIQNGILNGDYTRAGVPQDLSSPEAIEFAVQPNFNGTKIMVPGTPSKRY